VEAFRQDSIMLYILMLGSGFIASLTPCTYPVLPLTIGYIGNQAGANRWRTFILSLSLVTGLAVVYAVLGSIVSAVGGTFGSIMGNGLVLYAIAMYYLIMGLFLLDVFQIPNLKIFTTLHSRTANRKGLLGAFMIGGVSGLIVGPCTGPILAVALGAIALTLENVQGMDYALQIVKGGILLFLFGFGQGALILLAGTFTGVLYNLPKAGAWMEIIKKGFALLIIVTASLLFVFVGQNTDFPNMTRFLAGLESSSAPAPKPDVSSEARSPEVVAPSIPAPAAKPDASAQTRSPGVVAPSIPAPAAKPDVSAEPRSPGVVTPSIPAPAAIPDVSAEIRSPGVVTPSIPAPAPKPDVSAETQPPGVMEPPKMLAPDFTIAKLGQGSVTLSHLRGKKGVVLVFFATWCVACMKEVPEIEEFVKTAQKENIILFGVNFKQRAEIVERFKESYHVHYEILLDADGDVATGKFGITGLPHIIGINAKGEIIYRGTALPDNKDEFMKKLKQGLL